MNIRQRVGRLEESANHQKGIRLIVAQRQDGETEAEGIERHRQEWMPHQGVAVFLSETDLEL